MWTLLKRTLSPTTKSIYLFSRFSCACLRLFLSAFNKRHQDSEVAGGLKSVSIAWDGHQNGKRTKLNRTKVKTSFYFLCPFSNFFLSIQKRAAGEKHDTMHLRSTLSILHTPSRWNARYSGERCLLRSPQKSCHRPVHKASIENQPAMQSPRVACHLPLSCRTSIILTSNSFTLPAR